MTNIMQTGSRLALIALLAGTPAAVVAQTATDDTKTEVEGAVDNAGDAVEGAAEQTGDAIENAAEATGDAVEGAAEATGEAAEGAAEQMEAEVEAQTSTEGGVMEDSSTEMATEQPTEEEMAKPVEGQIVLQSENTILANDLIGSPVYSSGGDSIGEIDDMIVNLDGMVDGVVIGVGGFLGIGEKDVAIAMDSLSTTTDENGNIRLITSATEADLEAAEAFVTKEAQEAAQRSLETMPAADGTVPAAETAPATGN